jgi:ABC-type glycerol-3-phosphate transport system permease component
MNQRVRSIAIAVQVALLVAFAVIELYPLVFMFIASFKNNRDFYSNFWGLPSKLRWSNYAFVASDVVAWLRNTLIYSSVNVIVVLTVTSLSGYAFARFEFRFKGLMFSAILVLLMMPGILLVVPMYVMVSKWGLQDSIFSLVLPWTAVEIPIGTLILRRFFETQPLSLFEAGVLDGASELLLFRRIALPLATPALATMAILDVYFTANDLIWPLLVMKSNDRLPVAVGVLSYMGASGAVSWGDVFSVYTLASLPLILIFAFLGKSFADALTQGAIR